MNHPYTFIVGDRTFFLRMTASNEIQFYVELPPNYDYYNSEDYKNELRWARWGEDLSIIHTPRYSFEATGVGVNIFRFIRELKKQVKRLLSNNPVDFFYFTTTSPKKALLYKRIYRDVQNEFSEWDVQFIDDKYFYFYRKTTED